MTTRLRGLRLRLWDELRRRDEAEEVARRPEDTKGHEEESFFLGSDSRRIEYERKNFFVTSCLRGLRLRLRDELRRRDEAVEMPPDDLLDDDVRVFLLDQVRVEIVLPHVDGAAEVLG